MIASRFDTSPGSLARWVSSVANDINNLHPRARGRFWKTITGATSVNENWTFILCDASGGAVTPTLPTGMPKDHEIVFQDSGSAGTNNITITRGGTDTINGANTLVISTNYGRKTLISDGAGKWYAA